MNNAERLRLVSLIRESAVPMVPDPPPLPPEFEALRSIPFERGKIRAILFDVYGTLFCSAAGDIGVIAHNMIEGTAAGNVTGQGAALDDLAGQYGMFGVDMRLWFRDKVTEIHRAHSAETQWPEVNVEEIWGDRELALRYELAVNPVYPMPGAAETIAALREAGCVLGIVSNAQFFTPLLFETFFNAPPEGLGFDPDLLVWSYEMGEAKPSPRLFQTAARALAVKGIAAAECAFVGNDMLSDMYGAVNAGFQGVLFAGDSRSLKLREDDSRARGLRPFAVIRDLAEMVKIYRP
jgi:putative hydrolase of the HAD superfamily